MNGEAPDLGSLHALQDLLDSKPRNGVPIWKNGNSNVSIQTGEEFSMKFLQECAASKVVAPNYGEKVGVRNVQEGQMVYEELARVLGLGRMDSECGSDITEFASARGSITQIDNGVYLSNESMSYKDVGANDKTTNFTAEVCNPQANLVSTIPFLSESNSSRSLYSSGLGVSSGSQSGKIKLLCSFGGKILPRPSDGKLRYVGGETRIISIWKNLSWEELVKKTAGICNQPHSIKYQLPGEDLDSLISVSSDEDMQNMIDEYHGVEKPEGSQRLRIFLIPLTESETSCTHDASFIPQNDKDYQYVVAVNGMSESDPNPQKYQNSEMDHLKPDTESNPGYEKVFPFPIPPLGMKDSPEFFNESQKSIRTPSSTSLPVQQADMKNAMTKVHINNSTIGSIEAPALFSSPQRLEQNNSNFALCPQEGVAITERTSNFEAPLDLPDNLVQILPGSSDANSWYHGMTHAFSDSKLQEQGQKSAYSSLEGMNQSFSLNLGRPQSSSDAVSAALLETSMQLHENIGLINNQLQKKALNRGPTNPGVALLNSPLSSGSQCKFEVIHKATSSIVGKDQLAKEDYGNQFSNWKHHENGCVSNLEVMNKNDAVSHLLSSGEKSCVRESPVVAKELTNSLVNVKFEPVSHICNNSPKQDSQVSGSLAPVSSCIDLTPLKASELKLSQKSYLGKSSMEFTKGDPGSHSSWANNSEVAGLIHSSQEQYRDDSCYLLSNGLVACQIPLSQSFESSADIGRHELRVRGDETLDGPTDVGYAGWSNMPHKSALFRKEVSLIDEDLSNLADNGIEKSEYVGISNEHQKLQDGLLLVNNIQQHYQNIVPVAQYANYNFSPAEFPSTTVQDVSDATNVEICPSATEAESALQNLDSEAIFFLFYVIISFSNYLYIYM